MLRENPYDNRRIAIGVFALVPVVGLEPTRHRWQRILSPPRLPIPTHRHYRNDYSTFRAKWQVENQRAQRGFKTPAKNSQKQLQFPLMCVIIIDAL